MAPISIAVDIRHTSNLIRSEWFPTAMTNAGFMHSLLCTAALHLYYLGKSSLDTILYHQTQAIAAVNSAISHPDPRVSTSDANIGTVFNLLCIDEGLISPYLSKKERMEDLLIKREVHLNGLRKMVRMRGGLMTMHSNRILQAFILWCVTNFLLLGAGISVMGTNVPTGIRQRMPLLLLTLLTSLMLTTSAKTAFRPTPRATNPTSPVT
jgi:hypothetical protein